MVTAVKPETASRRWINQAVKAEINLCYTCASCVSECPVNRATNRLQPRKLVWMANMGFLEELLRLPDLWYCLSCNRCNHVCPMTVKPATLIRFLRWEAVRRGIVTTELNEKLRTLRREFQQRRWQTVLDLLDSGSPGSHSSLHVTSAFRTSDRAMDLARQAGSYFGFKTDVSSCFACEECSNACPVALDRGVFDPLRIFRMANLGMAEDLLGSPSLWLCIECQSCTQTCGQMVRGHLILRRLQDLAMEHGFVDQDFKNRWREHQAILYTRHLKQIDELLLSIGGLVEP